MKKIIVSHQKSAFNQQAPVDRQNGFWLLLYWYDIYRDLKSKFILKCTTGFDYFYSAEGLATIAVKTKNKRYDKV